MSRQRRPARDGRPQPGRRSPRGVAAAKEASRTRQGPLSSSNSNPGAHAGTDGCRHAYETSPREEACASTNAYIYVCSHRDATTKDPADSPI